MRLDINLLRTPAARVNSHAYIQVSRDVPSALYTTAVPTAEPDELPRSVDDQWPELVVQCPKPARNTMGLPTGVVRALPRVEQHTEGAGDAGVYD